MKDTRERPICHRAEDLVSFLYGESNEADALDFGRHLQQCDACRSEFGVFNQVHDSMQLWRNEALGASLSENQVAYQPVPDSPQVVRYGRKLSAMAALREFFTVSPLWLRGATALGALLLIVLGVITIARISREPVRLANVKGEKTYTKEELDTAVNKAVDRTREELASRENEAPLSIVKKQEPRPPAKSTQLATNQVRTPRPRSLNRQEREQLAADLRLTNSAEDDESLLALPEQDTPRE